MAAPTMNLESGTDPHIERDQTTLIRFVQTYCGDLHRSTTRDLFELKTIDVAGLNGRPMTLCPACAKLLAHALVKRSVCPMDPKPACNDCPQHCYHPAYRQQIRQVMKHSGQKLVMRGRLDYLIHLIF
jgi:hypothetical protein